MTLASRKPRSHHATPSSNRWRGGSNGTSVAAVGELVPSLENAFATGGVHVVAVPIDYSENDRVLVRELRDRLNADQDVP